MSTEFIIATAIQLVALGVVWGTVITKINFLEKKQDKHNSLIERVYKLEEKEHSNRADIDRHEQQHERNKELMGVQLGNQKS